MKHLSVLAFSLILLCVVSPSSAVLNILYQNSGLLSLSVNGRGSNTNPLTFPINKPTNGATVLKAYLFQTTNNIVPQPVTISQGSNSLSITSWDMTNVNSFLQSGVKDVTATMAAWLNPLGLGDATIAITETNTFSVDGEVLVVVWNRPDLPSPRSVTLMFGAALSTGDTTALLSFNPPLQYGTDELTMGLGIGFSYDNCGTAVQFSNVFVNGLKLSGSAGNYDVGEPADGALLTVGTAARGMTYNPNPLTPAAEICNDKEYYDLGQFMHSQGQNTISSVSITTNNPSRDDNVFLVYFDASVPSSAVTGNIAIGAINACNTQDVAVPAGLFAGNNGSPSVGVTLTLTITAGPNAGFTQTRVTNAQGLVTFTVPHAASGTDTYKVSSTSPAAQATSTITWSAATCPDGGPTCPDSYVLAASDTYEEVSSSGKCVCLTSNN